MPSPSPIVSAPVASSAASTASAARQPPAPRQLRTSATSLEDERRIVDAAQAALARGDTRSALASTEEHARQFPGGQLVAEREAIAVRALAVGGREAEARSRAARFLREHPNHVLTEVVEQAARMGEIDAGE